jgi:hypothetical protein
MKLNYYDAFCSQIASNFLHPLKKYNNKSKLLVVSMNCSTSPSTNPFNDLKGAIRA